MKNTCVCCGREIPEGRQVCYICEKNSLLNLPVDDPACTIVVDDWAE